MPLITSQAPTRRGKVRWGQNVYAADASLTAVSDAVTAASAGDTVIVPAEEVEWASALTVSKAVQVVGQGIGNTVITCTGNTAFTIATSGVRISGFTVLEGNPAVLASSGTGWRIDHCRFASTTFKVGVSVRGGSKTTYQNGLCDHCEFVNQRALTQPYPGTSASELNGTTHWSQPLALGTDEAFYVEDCTFTFSVFGNCIDANHAGRYVFRHNVVTNAYLEAHSVQSVANRGTRKWEIYNNTIQQVDVAVYRPFLLRGGTGVVFNNTITGTFGSPYLNLDNVRSFTDVGGEPGKADGDSPWDGNEDASGYPARDQIGRGLDSGTWTSAPYPSQSSVPAYFWDNTLNDDPLTVLVADAESAVHIVEERDYYVNAGAMPGYTAYTYPHPLQTAFG